MSQEAPRPFLTVLPPAAETPTPDYSEATPGQLRRAHAVNVGRLISADIGHLFLKGTILANELLRWFLGDEEEIDWDPEVQGLRPDLDEKQQSATQELSLRRGRR
jgi:hypothetical protein